MGKLRLQMRTFFEPSGRSHRVEETSALVMDQQYRHAMLLPRPARLRLHRARQSL